MDKKFNDYLDQLCKEDQPASQAEIDRIYQRIEQKEGLQRPHPQRRQRRLAKPLALIAACLVLLIGAAALLPQLTGNDSMPAHDADRGFSNEFIYAAADYQDIFTALEQNRLINDTMRLEASSADISADMGAAPESADSAEISGNISQDDFDSAQDSDYSETNVQVEGIDEGDIVKTDGKYIYLLRHKELIISSAQGGASEIISQTEILPDDEDTNAQNYHQYASEIYLANDYLAIITSKSSWQTLEGDNSIYPYWSSNDTCRVLIYDISNPSKPRQLDSLGQDGYYLNSRLVGNTLYLISNHYIYDEIEQDQPETYVPSVYRNEQAAVISAQDICILPHFDSTSYTVISSIDLDSQELIDTTSVLGGSDTVYMSYDNLFLTVSRYQTEESEPYTEDQYSVIAYEERNMTDIMRFALHQGEITLKAAGQAEGYLLNQFSLDEYDGHLRLVTTLHQNSYKIYTDKKRDWSYYDWVEAEDSTNALWVLNDQLELVGSLKNLAPGERIYSARFSGDISYFVTFRQVDPLFAVDLSDAASPVILSELKIPGFSQYLHNYTDGRLFGLGMDADEETGRTNGMKLSMFNIEDPADVSEKHTLLLDSNYSEALHNHKAILISAKHDLIAFPVENGYDVYGYDDARGFYQKGRFDSGKWSYNTRGLYVDKYIYICTMEDISIIDMDTLELIKTLDLGEYGEEIGLI